MKKTTKMDLEASGKPMGLCTEESSLFVTDGQIGTVKLKTTIRGTVEFLENLGRFYHGIFRAIQASAM